jgi:hypothetical protein
MPGGTFRGAELSDLGSPRFAVLNANSESGVLRFVLLMFYFVVKHPAKFRRAITGRWVIAIGQCCRLNLAF